MRSMKFYEDYTKKRSEAGWQDGWQAGWLAGLMDGRLAGWLAGESKGHTFLPCTTVFHVHIHPSPLY